jgi:Ca2+-binding EF-hand superfamily protein
LKKAAADQLVSALASNGDGSASNGALLGTSGQLGSNPDDATTQSLFTMFDTSKGEYVRSSDFFEFETAFEASSYTQVSPRQP